MLSVTTQRKCRPKLLSQEHTQALTATIVTIMMESQQFHPACRMALKVLGIKDHEKRKPSSGRGIYGRDRHSFLECMETLLQTRALSAADRKNSQNPRKGSSGHLNLTNLRRSKINVREPCESSASGFISAL